MATMVVMATATVGFIGFIIGNGLGLVWSVQFWLVWLAYAAVRRVYAKAAFGSLLPWLFPAWALLSMIWSREPVTSGRNAIELMLTTGVAVMIPFVLTARGILISFFLALLVSFVVGLAFGHTEIVYVGNVEASQGIFGSKNSFAMLASMLSFSAMALLFARGVPRWLRAAAIVALAVAAYGLLQAHSVGATVGAAAGCGILLLVRLLQALPGPARGAIGMGGLAAFGIVVPLLLIFSDQHLLDSALAMVGKSPTLTGRTYLWARAQETIDQHGWLGVGYQAYWRQGQIDAEGLWRYLMISSRSGVTMHNLYYQTMIETGAIGTLILGGSLIATILASAFSAIVRPDPMGPFGVAVSLFFASRIFLETEFLAPFLMGTMMLPLIWSHSWSNIKAWSGMVTVHPPT